MWAYERKHLLLVLFNTSVLQYVVDTFSVTYLISRLVKESGPSVLIQYALLLQRLELPPVQMMELH